MTPNRAEAFRALAQAVLVMIGLWAPGFVYALWTRGQATPNLEAAAPGLLWGAAVILPLGIVFALVSKGDVRAKALRGGQYVVLIVALSLLFMSVRLLAA